MRIFTDGTDGTEWVSLDKMHKFWNSLEEPKGKPSVPWAVLFRNQDKVVITIERGKVHIETDINHTLFFNRFMENEFEIEFWIRCEYCKCFTPASRLCEHCGALIL